MRYDLLDPGIREVVRWLRAAGFDTYDSGDGVSKTDWIARGTAMRVPHVFIRTTPAAMTTDARDLLWAVRATGVDVQSSLVARGSAVTVEAWYCTVTDTAWMCLVGFDDAALPSTPHPSKRATEIKS